MYKHDKKSTMGECGVKITFGDVVLGGTSSFRRGQESECDGIL